MKRILRISFKTLVAIIGCFVAWYVLRDRDQFFENNEDITVDWDFLVGVEARYRFTDSAIDKGLFLQGTFGFEGWTITNDDQAQDDFDNWYASLGVGLVSIQKASFPFGCVLQRSVYPQQY